MQVVKMLLYWIFSWFHAYLLRYYSSGRLSSRSCIVVCDSCSVQCFVNSPSAAVARPEPVLLLQHLHRKVSCPLQHPHVLSTLLEFTWSDADKDGVRSCIGRNRHLRWNWMYCCNPGGEVEKCFPILYYITLYYINYAVNNCKHSESYIYEEGCWRIFLTTNWRESASPYGMLWLNSHFFGSWPGLTKSCVGVENIILSLKN